jgi:hypothetical protein
VHGVSGPWTMQGHIIVGMDNAGGQLYHATRKTVGGNHGGQVHGAIGQCKSDNCVEGP